MTVVARFWAYARPYAGVYLVGLLLLGLTNALGLWIPWLLRDAIQTIEDGGGLRVLAGIALMMVFAALGQAVVRTLSRLTILGNSRRIAYDVRRRFFEHLLRLGADFYDRQRTGDIMSRGVNDIQQLQGVFGPGVLNLLNTAIAYVATLALMLTIDPELTLVSLAVYPVLLLVVNRLSRRVYAKSIAVQEQLATISTRTQENISGIQQVKTYVQEDREIEDFAQLCEEYRSRNLGMAMIRGWMMSLIGVVTGVGTLLVLYVGGLHVIEGKISFGDFVAFNAYLAQLVWPTVALGWIINTFQRGAGALTRLDGVLAVEPELPPHVDRDDDRDRPDPSALAGDISIRGLTFAYEDTEERRRHVLRDVELTIPGGSRVAIVGPVGSGKSTLAALLARAYRIPDGKIFIGDRDINDIPIRDLRASLGYVPQEALLFSRSVRENVRFHRPWIADDGIESAVSGARLARDLAAFPDGLDTVVGERGFTLSGGQRQRATLARALAGDPSILILDDSFSSLDADTEKTVLQELDARPGRRTTILITHRLSTLVGMDRIIVLGEGRVVEDGSHDELMSHDGVYADLFRRYQLEQSLEV